VNMREEEELAHLQVRPTCQDVHLGKTRPSWLPPKKNHLLKPTWGLFAWFCKGEGVGNPVS
jgi:hypothetical protein